ncbi:rhodanese-related sulfurtransferase [Sphingobacterium allocomposti]|uniref:Rhodanese-related sulfurtransferase n=1 Tax=Sphingobacterium allocomposti TaxID=415956 RepID=A0A5S5DKZ6_9SPHI|nr:rhodanese-like domain-containing protein [Sphingobacterium composti Yoo et al. 2007 non Ten et al. 2007]TYP96581.1 rhodanese-related sulfurtransferase [Sphingobacterium composti Yoo et al. 2007 non Ten et al. 2007]HLS96031.1 rhodanese-like domain-containing protein [Sphingobacterium sp.]
MKVTIVLLGVLSVLYIGYRIFRIYTAEQGLGRLLDEGAVVLDVRTAQEFERGHIKGAVNISLGEIRDRYVELDTSKVYITVCSHGLRSVKAENILKDKGFRRVYNGGAWSDLQRHVKTE